MSDAPEGVRLVLANGDVVRCTVHRAPDLDKPGIRYWRAVPDGAVPPADYQVAYDKLYPHTGFKVDLGGS